MPIVEVYSKTSVTQERGPCTGSSNDVCQACLRCNVDLQYQVRSFPLAECGDHTSGGTCSSAPEHGGTASSATEHLGSSSSAPEHDGAQQAFSLPLPAILRGIASTAGSAQPEVHDILRSFAVAVRSSHVADFYATKYLAKPQQWLASVLGPLILGFRRVEEQTAHREEPLNTTSQALCHNRVANFAANRAVWVSCCEASLLSAH